MKKLFVPFILASILFSSFKDNEYSFVREFKITAPVNLKISTSGGNINASGYDKDVVEVAFVVKKRNQLLEISFEELQKIAEVEIVNENNYLEISVEKISEKNVSIGFNIKTPFNTSCNFHTSGGNIKVTEITGNHDINTSGGNLTFENINGTVAANTSGGNITINNSKADIIAKTSGGNVSIENIDGKVETHTSGGNIKIKNSKFDAIAETSGGNIELTEVQGQIDVNTSGGSISLNNISGSVTATTSGGSISANIIKLTDKLILGTSGGSITANIPSGLGLDLNLKGYKVNTQLNNFSGKAEKGKIIGQINGGGIQVDLSTTGGNVNLNYK
jgi:DUF4097 and DUF4098 domain-containing protein YvlB